MEAYGFARNECYLSDKLLHLAVISLGGKIAKEFGRQIQDHMFLLESHTITPKNVVGLLVIQ